MILGTSMTRIARLAAGLVTATALAASLTACATFGGAPSEPLTSGVDADAAAAVPADLREAGVLNVAIDLPYPPFAFVDNQGGLTGLDVDLSYAIGEKLDIPVNVRKQAFDSVIPSLQAGMNDIIISGMNDTAERQEVLDFVDYIHAGFLIVVAYGNPEGITGMGDLCGMSVASQKASVSGDILREASDACTAGGEAPITILELPSSNDTQTAVQAGNAVALLADAPIGRYLIETANDGTAFEGVEDPSEPAGFAPVYTGMAVLNSREGFAEAVRLAFQALIDDGTYARLCAKYGLESYMVDGAYLNLGTE